MAWVSTFYAFEGTLGQARLAGRRDGLEKQYLVM